MHRLQKFVEKFECTNMCLGISWKRKSFVFTFSVSLVATGCEPFPLVISNPFCLLYFCTKSKSIEIIKLHQTSIFNLKVNILAKFWWKCWCWLWVILVSRTSKTFLRIQASFFRSKAMHQIKSSFLSWRRKWEIHVMLWFTDHWYWNWCEHRIIRVAENCKYWK